jgi:hypothetical protein
MNRRLGYDCSYELKCCKKYINEQEQVRWYEHLKSIVKLWNVIKPDET